MRDSSGNAPLESIFGMLFVLLLALGLIQTALVLYGRNVVISSAHEGARRAIELGRSPQEAEDIALTTIRRSAGALVNDLEIDVTVEKVAGGSLLRVSVAADLRAMGPLPIEVPVEAIASSSREEGL